MKRTTGSASSSKASPVAPHALIVVAPTSPRVSDTGRVEVKAHVGGTCSVGQVRDGVKTKGSCRGGEGDG